MPQMPALAQLVLLVLAAPLPTGAGNSWSAAAHNNTSCEWTPRALVAQGDSGSLASCQHQCEQNARCAFICHADPPGNGACELYSSCAKPFCRPGGKGPPHGWWDTHQLTSRDAKPFPPCAPPPPPGPPPPPPPGPPAAWFPATEGWTGKIKPFWFGANHTGLDSEETLALMAKHSVAGYGWQTGGAAQDGVQSVGRGDGWGAAAFARAADYMQAHGRGSNVTIFQYRQIQVALRLFAQCAIAVGDPANEEFWLHDEITKELCLAKQPWGTADPYWNFTSENATKYWVERVIGELATDDSMTGNAPMSAVFFDEVDQGFCGYHGGNCNFSNFKTEALQKSSNEMLTQMVARLNSAGITPILSLDNRLAASCDGLPSSPASAPCGTPACALPEDDTIAALKGLTWVRFYENWPASFWHAAGPDQSAAMVQNAILEGAAGVPNVLHIGGSCPGSPRTITRPGPLGGALEFAVASYLVVVAAGTTLSVSNGWFDESFCWHPEFDVEYGTPLGPAKRTGPHSWTRNFTLANVAIDVSAGRQGSVDLIDAATPAADTAAATGKGSTPPPPPFVLDLAPAAPVATQAFANRTLSSWGGNAAKHTDGKYHMFAAAMTQGCNLGAWKTNSEVIHAVGDTPLGPFKFVEVLLGRWHHNPQLFVHPDGTWMILSMSTVGALQLILSFDFDCCCLPSSF